MKKESVVKFVSSYSVIIGVVLTLLSLGQEVAEGEPNLIFLYVILTILGLVALGYSGKNKMLELISMIVITVFYSLEILGLAFLLLSGTLVVYSLIVLLILAAPFGFSIYYFIILGHKEKVEVLPSLTTTLSAYKELLDRKMIDETEYNRLVKLQLENHDIQTEG